MYHHCETKCLQFASLCSHINSSGYVVNLSQKASEDGLDPALCTWRAMHQLPIIDNIEEFIIGSLVSHHDGWRLYYK